MIYHTRKRNLPTKCPKCGNNDEKMQDTTKGDDKFSALFKVYMFGFRHRKLRREAPWDGYYYWVAECGQCVFKEGLTGKNSLFGGPPS